MGSAVLEFMADRGYTPRVVRVGIPDEFVTHGPVADLYRLCGMDADGILQQLRALCQPEPETMSQRERRNE
jgi:1-deoxy-D-xylulose-5-phosphate synthase